MVTIKEIEEAVKSLPPEQYKAFRRWFDEYEARQWDAQIERDVNAGKLDELAQKAIQDYESGDTTEL